MTSSSPRTWGTVKRRSSLLNKLRAAHKILTNYQSTYNYGLVIGYPDVFKEERRKALERVERLLSLYNRQRR